MVDQTAGTRTTGGNPDPMAADEVDDLGNGQEVSGETECGDIGELGVEPGPGRPGAVAIRVAPVELCHASLPQHLIATDVGVR